MKTLKERQEDREKRNEDNASAEDHANAGFARSDLSGDNEPGQDDSKGSNQDTDGADATKKHLTGEVNNKTEGADNGPGDGKPPTGPEQVGKTGGEGHHGGEGEPGAKKSAEAQKSADQKSQEPKKSDAQKAREAAGRASTVDTGWGSPNTGSRATGPANQRSSKHPQMT